MEAVCYRVSFPQPGAHLVAVRLEFVAPAGEICQVWMPAWTPGSYLIREYARNVRTLAARVDDQPVAAEKLTKDRWQIPARPGQRVVVDYTVYAHDLSVRTAHHDATHAFLHPPQICLVPEGAAGPFTVEVELLPGWSAISLAADPDSQERRSPGLFAVDLPDLDSLHDTPIEAGILSLGALPEPAGHVRLAVWGEPIPEFVLPRLARVVAQVERTWPARPYGAYTFLVHAVVGARGGLEHLSGSVLGVDPESFAPAARRLAAGAALDDDSDAGTVDFLELASHELFHAWNVKRLHPRPLGPFDYDHENYTTSLWISEGFTAYYDDLVLVRAGLIKPSDHLSRLSAAIAALQQRPGHLVQSLDESSFDTWIKHYRPDENADNRQVDYYVKGSLTAWLLDAAIRQATQDRRSLDDVMRTAWERFPPERGFDEPEFEALFSEVAGTDLSAMVDALVVGRDEVDFTPALAWWGLRFAEPEELDDRHKPKVWTGLDAAATVTRVLRGTPAFEAGVNVGDELIGLDGVRINGGDMTPMLMQRDPGETAQLLVSRRGTLITLPIVLAAAPTATWKLEFDPDASVAVSTRRKAWWQAEEPSEP